MLRPQDLRCRVRATHAAETHLWSFYFINDSLAAIDLAELEAVKYEFGDEYVGGTSPAVSVADVAPGASVLIWTEDDPELRTDLWFRVTYRGAQTWLLFEFPKLDCQRRTMGVAHGHAMDGPPL